MEAAASSCPLVDAVGALLEGEDWEAQTNLGLFVVRFPSETDPGDAGWHIDGSFLGSSLLAPLPEPECEIALATGPRAMETG